MVLYIGNLMMLGLLFLGQVLIISADGNHYNTWLKDCILMWQYSAQMAKSSQLMIISMQPKH
jgi:hypothetical protein